MPAKKHFVMVVDDDEAIRETLRELLEDLGYDVVCAANGKSALDQLDAEGVAPCMIFLDLMMPVMDGWTFRRTQLADPRIATIPVVVITASEEANGAFSDVIILRKPLEFEAVLKAVEARC